MKTSDQLTIEYAANRIHFREVKDEIYNIMYPCDKNGVSFAGSENWVGDKMQQFFKEWCEQTDDYYGREPWPDGGWPEVLEEAEIDDPDMLALANLWVLKKSIIREGGQIRRNIAARGRKLLRDKAE